jgi:HAD superfamily hydrolase (TIGR01509 family)
MKNIVFDFGGVVFHWQPHELMRRALPLRAHDDASAHAMVGDFFEGYRGDWGSFDRGTIAEPELAPRIAARLGLSLQEVRAVIDAVPGELQPQQDTVDLLHRLHAKGHPLYYLSNMPARYADHLESSHAFFDRFTDGIFSARVQLIKPEPEIFALATQRFGVVPAQTVFIDDMLYNVEAARAHGWQAVHFKDAAQCEAELQALL